MLKEIIYENDPQNFEDLCECVFKTVQEYFGDYSNINHKMNYYKELDFIFYDDIGRNFAYSTEQKQR